MRAVELHLRPEDGVFPGVDEDIAAIDGVTRETIINFDWHSDGSFTILYRLSGADAGPLQAVLDDHEDVNSYELVTEGDTRIYAFVHVSEREMLSELLRITEDNALLLDPPFRYTAEGLRATVVGSEESLQSAFAEASDQIDVDVESTGGFVPDEPEYLDRMTDRQYEALVAAYELGYYETPRTVSFEEVATELGCAPSTANELLRRAEGELVDAILAR